MWILRKCNWSEFCNTGDEHHAICLGLFFPIVLWWPVSKYQVGEAARLFNSEPWYVGFGTFLRFCFFLGIILWRLA